MVVDWRHREGVAVATTLQPMVIDLVPDAHEQLTQLVPRLALTPIQHTTVAPIAILVRVFDNHPRRAAGRCAHQQRLEDWILRELGHNRVVHDLVLH